jgi:hypothetical protein
MKNIGASNSVTVRPINAKIVVAQIVQYQVLTVCRIVVLVSFEALDAFVAIIQVAVGFLQLCSLSRSLCCVLLREFHTDRLVNMLKQYKTVVHHRFTLKLQAHIDLKRLKR